MLEEEMKLLESRTFVDVFSLKKKKLSLHPALNRYIFYKKQWSEFEPSPAP